MDIEQRSKLWLVCFATLFLTVQARAVEPTVEPAATGESVSVFRTISPSEARIEETSPIRYAQAASDDDSASSEAVEKPGGTAERGEVLGRELGQRRPEDQFTMQLFGRPLTIGGEVELEIDDRDGRSLSDAVRDGVREAELGIEVEFFYVPTENLALFAKLQGTSQRDISVEEGEKESDSFLSRSQLWLFWNRLFDTNSALQVGRQTIDETREWWWDERLESIRLFYAPSSVLIQLAVAEQLVAARFGKKLDPEDKDILRFLGNVDWEWAKRQHVQLFYLNHDDQSETPTPGDVFAQDREDDVDGEFDWIGVRAHGRAKSKQLGRLRYWADIGYITGEETLIDFDDLDANRSEVDDIADQRVRGWGLDLGASWRTKLPGKPYFTLAYAVGSGDGNADDNLDRSYRQTGLQGNEWKFWGETRFPYYGVFLDPELSNLEVSTLGVGWPLFEDSSIDLVFHTYRQDEAADRIRDSFLRARPSGSDKDIGRELDLVLALEEWTHWKFELQAGVFEAGRAFNDREDETGYRVNFELEYSF